MTLRERPLNDTHDPAAPHHEWVLHEPSFIGDEEDPERATGPWAGHRWFGYDLVAWARPRRIVELGTHYGVSFFALAQAVRDEQLDAELHAVDTWKGDPHAGFYEGVYEHVQRIIEERFQDTSITLHRCTFDEALERFEDGSVDLLHIDGFHSYEAAKHDLDTWLPKLAPNGIVLMHDVAPDSGYGSTQHWEQEVASAYPSFRFEHYFGLGIALPKGTRGREYLFSDEFHRWRRYYEHRAERRLGEQRYADQTRMIEERDRSIAAQERLVAERDEALARQMRMIDDRDEAIAAQTHLVDERDAALAAQARLIDERDEALAAQSRTIDEQDRALATTRAELDASQQKRTELAQRLTQVGQELRRFEGAWYADPPPETSAAGGTPDGGQDGEAGARAHAHAGGGDPRGRVDRLVQPLPEGLEHLARVAQRRVWAVRERWRDAQAGYARAAATAPYIDADQVGARTAWGAAVRYERGRRGGEATAGFGSAFYRDFNDLPRTTNAFHHFLTTGLAQGTPPAPHALAQLVTNPYRPPCSLPAPATLHGPDHDPVEIESVADLDLTGVELLTFDLWDTLIERTRPGESVKLTVAGWLAEQDPLRAADVERWELYRQRVEIEAELARARADEHGFGEYAADEVLDRVLTRVVPDLTAADRRDLVSRALTFEVATEQAHTGPRWEPVELLRRARDAGLEVAVVSDFYLREEHLRAIAVSCGIEVDAVSFHVSVDAGTSKAAGGQLLRRCRGQIAADRHLHVGDNDVADVGNQLATGGRALHVPRSPSTASFPAGVLEPASLARSLVPSLRAHRLRFDRAGDRQPTSPAELALRETAILRDAGAELANVAVAVVWSAAARARELGVARVHYLSREGATLARVHERVAGTLGVADVSASHLPLSRRLTFGPSLASLDATELARMWLVYRGQTLGEVLASLGLSTGHVVQDLARLGTSGDDVLSTDDVVQVLTTGALGERVQMHLELQRDRARTYLEDVFGADEVAIVADVGWRGSIQDNLTRLLPGRLFHGTYAALLPFLSPQPANSGKFAAGPDANLGDDVSAIEPHVSVIERLLSAPVAAPVRFARRPDGRVEVATGSEPAVSARAEELRAGLLEAAPSVAGVLVGSGLGPHDLGALVADTLERFVTAPAPIVARAVLEQPQVEDFGSVTIHGGFDGEHAAQAVLDAVREGAPIAPPAVTWTAGAEVHPTVLAGRAAFEERE